MVRGTTQAVVQNLHDRFSVLADQSVVDVFALTPGVHQALGAQHRQLLRQGGLTNAQVFFQFADAELTLCETAQEDKAVSVGKYLEQRTRLFCRDLQGSQVWLGDPLVRW